MYDPDSLLELISAIPTLENLSLDSGSFGHLNFTSPALSNLRYFCFGNDDEEFEGISSIIEKSKNTLKFIEINAWFEPSEGLQDVFEPVKDTLEGLFTRLFTKQVTKSVTDLSFPKLRVIKTGCYDDITSEIDWLQAPMLKNVRTIVQDAYSTKIYWGNALRAAGVNALKKVPNFKHIVCTANLDSKYREDSDFIHPDLFELFKSHGVQCHVSPNLTADEIMLTFNQHVHPHSNSIAIQEKCSYKAIKDTQQMFASTLLSIKNPLSRACFFQMTWNFISVQFQRQKMTVVKAL
ncbi:uncharacterized protein MELLADRAFT_104639 [Melampsora larici-populina 98AG31]|uniref:Uncharacterized protein n=1 Tax=Melampsora larici-populina (strain 98AG31 / pathotype 3-4-7) TaxID=747676 RepID=F4RFE3_MELLP|nr:uncharacterized protein MELLADRAFT_104639 [Melampsora larici-populina 98AG31]EGG08948.1 hypothetical protein MELLADRAFT_104639 [Melampsora larici-populina 98AG31]